MNNKKQENYLKKATIKKIIVAFIYVVTICFFIIIFFSKPISKAISLIELISVETNNEELKEVKINFATKNLESYPNYGTKYGTLTIPSLEINMPLYYGDTLSILRLGIGHSSGSYFPGEGGTILCMGHNKRGMLRELPNIKNDDEIIIDTTYGKYTYKVYDTKIVEQTQLEAAPIQREKEILMLYTCYPVNSIGNTKNRFFAYANLVKEEIKE